ncbi:MAG TPA: sialidase family protein [Phycisphaerales bacterium]|nr:sialidase family protein [Phycisphaerales bacterium]
MLIAAAVSVALFFAPAQPAAEKPLVTAERSPGQGIQPQTLVGGDGALHLLTYHGDARGGDLFYQRRESGGAWSKAQRVNSTPGSAVAVGNSRGGQIALGHDGAVHVAWNGATTGKPKGEGSPMLYSRLTGGADAFQKQRNLMTRSRELDGGGSVAADSNGRVYVVWHGLPSDPKAKGESDRRVFVAASTDDGATFAPEEPVSEGVNGACGCCGLRAAALPDGALLILYRAAGERVNRDMRLLRSCDGAKTFADVRLDPWKLDTCPMTTASAAPLRPGAVAAWETQQRIRWATLRADGKPVEAHDVATGGKGQRYPAVAVDAAGRVMVAWTEGMRWNTGGKACWQVFDSAGKPIADAAGEVEGVAPWGLVAAAPRPGGGFFVFY